MRSLRTLAGLGLLLLGGMAPAGCGCGGGNGGDVDAAPPDPDGAPPDAGPDAGVRDPGFFVDETTISPATSLALTAVATAPLAFDYDGDGDVDLAVLSGYTLLEGKAGGVALLENDGTGAFTDVAAARGLTGTAKYSTPAAFDCDNDGDLDLYLPAVESFVDGQLTKDGLDALYRNDGAGNFTDVTAQAGIVENTTTFNVAVADYDGDGLLDIYVPESIDQDFVDAAFQNPFSTLSSDKGDPDLLFRNVGDCTFVEDSLAAGVGAANPNLGIARKIDDAGQAALFIDYDSDGDPDLLVGNYGGYVIVYRNDGGVFADVTVESGVKAMGWGVWTSFAPTDLDGDGVFEIVVANAGTSFLAQPRDTLGGVFADDLRPLALALRYNGDGTFTDVASAIVVDGVPPMPQQLSLPPPEPETLQVLPWGWGLSAFDFDNDGLEDLYQTGSFGVTTNLGVIGTTDKGASVGVLLQRSGNGAFVDKTVAATLDDVRLADGFILPGWGNTYADLDADGRLDVVVANITLMDLPGQLRVFRNDLARFGNTNHWVAFKLIGTTSNRDGIGAEVRLFVTAEAAPQLRGSFVSGWTQPRDALHFGLGAATSAARVEISWPSGVRQVLVDVAADQIVEVTEEPPAGGGPDGGSADGGVDGGV